MDPTAVWTQFRDKIARDSLQDSDCFPRAGVSYAKILSDPRWANLRKAIAAVQAASWEIGEGKLVYTIPLGKTDHLRLDFILRGETWLFYLLDGVTIPIKALPALPYSEFPPLPDTENRLRMERIVSEKVHFYCKLKSYFGAAKALEWFRDGQGYRLNVESWLPYFTVRKAFVLASAWMENRYWGQGMVVVELSEDRARLQFREHEYLLLYEMTGHLKPQLSLLEYRELFEDQWRDRCKYAGWEVAFEYPNKDTLMIMSALPAGWEDKA